MWSFWIPSDSPLDTPVFYCRYREWRLALDELRHDPRSIAYTYDLSEETPLHYAAKYANVEVIDKLLDLRANPNATDFIGMRFRKTDLTRQLKRLCTNWQLTMPPMLSRPLKCSWRLAQNPIWRIVTTILQAPSLWRTKTTSCLRFVRLDSWWLTILAFGARFTSWRLEISLLVIILAFAQKIGQWRGRWTSYQEN